MSLERQIRPEDLIDVREQAGEVWFVGLRHTELFGKDAAEAYGAWAFFSGIEGCEDSYDPKQADEAAQRYQEITGISPLSVALEFYVIRERLGISTSRII